MEQKIGWYAHPQFNTWAEPFEDKYEMVDMIACGDPEYAISKTRRKDGRHCIFCNKSYPEVTFRNDAHLLSKMIGNIDLFSTFECDTCNSKFSRFETDLSYFLGLGRSISGLNHNKKAPGFAGIGIEAKSIWYKNKKLMVIRKEDAERNEEEASTKLKYQKPTYTPANIYKLFLKCALSILPKEEVIRDYQLALQFLRGGTFLGGSHINLYRFPLTVTMPLHVYIFKKKNVGDNLPEYVTSFYFDNIVISCPVLLHRNDVLNSGEMISLPAAPPYFIYGNDLDNVVPQFSTHDVSSPLKLKLEPEEITLQFDKEDLKNSSRLDTKSGEVTQTPYQPLGSKYFVAGEHGMEFTKEEMIDMVSVIDAEFSK